MKEPSVQHSIVETVAEAIGQLLPQPAHCLSFEEDARHYGPLNRRPVGLRTVPLNRIVGSVGRARELGVYFQPLQTRRWRQNERYRRIFEAMQAGEILPPVELYKLGYHYYVLDGNHRVAAAKALTHNDGEIDAVVTQFWPVGDTEAARVFIERHSFERATGLKNVGAVERGHYPLLQQEIEAHQQHLAATRPPVAAGGPAAPSLREAATDWLVSVWQPRAEAIRRSGLGRRWPDKRTADIYCYILEQQHGAPLAPPSDHEPADQATPTPQSTAPATLVVDWETALARFRALHSPSPPGHAARLRQLLQRALRRSGRPAITVLSAPTDAFDPEANTAIESTP
jgi:hypothetical protein